ncbi:MAG: hypothetical protein HOI23_14835, partial [Deltaproteobacteria bacterium]|nr:hypothetical protein [Deltaproteobacteria bacterium]
MTKPETMTIDMDPRQYITKVSAKDGSTIEGAYSPEQLLVSAHRDYHPADVTARMAMSQLVDFTGDEGWVKKVMKRTRRLGHRSIGTMASVLPFSSPEKMAMTMWGLKDRNYRFEFEKVEMEQDIHMGIVEKLQAAGAAQLSKVQAIGGIRILLTGGTGFLGQEIITQVAQDTSIQEIAIVIRPKVIRDRRTKEVVTVISPSERGFKLLDDLGIQDAQERSRFRFIAGDIERPLF